jgi:hypothetical protein
MTQLCVSTLSSKKPKSSKVLALLSATSNDEVTWPLKRPFSCAMPKSTPGYQAAIATCDTPIVRAEAKAAAAAVISRNAASGSAA